MKVRVVLYCLDVVGKAMAGPAIRYWEFAKALSKKHEVLLLIPNEPEIASDQFKIKSFATINLANELKNTDVLIIQRLKPHLAYLIKKLKVKVILDAYDPIPLEHIEIFKHEEMLIRRWRNREITQSLKFSFQMSDGIICANTKQRDLWMGLAMGLNCITPQMYDEDVSLKSYLDVVPFGLPSTPPQKNGEGIRNMFNLKETDKIILWGGGIWNWFDPLSLIRAMKTLKGQRPEIKLIFMGIKHPNPKIPKMRMSVEALTLAKDLDLVNKNVFFNEGWVSYEQRQNFLLEADIGVSTHFEHLETQYSFRTRILDYIWAGLPMITTTGDYFAEFVEFHHLGIVVPYEDSKAIADAILQIVDSPNGKLAIKNQLLKIRESFYWEKITQPLDRMIQLLAAKPKKRLQLSDVKAILKTACYRICFTPAIAKHALNKVWRHDPS